jgi:two-component system, NarL family, invasion response regulator UvrY
MTSGNFARGTFIVAKAIRLLICDDHIAIITGLTALLKSYPVKIVGTVLDSTKIMAEYAKLKPDVVLMDIRFAPQAPTGLQITEQLLRKYPRARVVIYSQFDSDEVIKEAYRLKSSAFVTKDTDPEILMEAIAKANDGKYFYLPSISERLLQLGLQAGNSPQSKLDERELAVFKHMAAGAEYEEIARQIGVSLRLVNTIGRNIKHKLGVDKPAEITLLAVKHGLIKP